MVVAKNPLSRIQFIYNRESWNNARGKKFSNSPGGLLKESSVSQSEDDKSFHSLARKGDICKLERSQYLWYIWYLVHGQQGIFGSVKVDHRFIKGK